MYEGSLTEASHAPDAIMASTCPVRAGTFPSDAGRKPSLFGSLCIHILAESFQFAALAGVLMLRLNRLRQADAAGTTFGLPTTVLRQYRNVSSSMHSKQPSKKKAWGHRLQAALPLARLRRLVVLLPLVRAASGPPTAVLIAE